MEAALVLSKLEERKVREKEKEKEKGMDTNLIVVALFVKI
jgi:hypothetical protein